MTLFGILRDIPAWEGVALFALLALVMGFVGAGRPAWTLLLASGLFAWGAPVPVWLGAGLAAALVIVPPVRRLLSRPVMRAVAREEYAEETRYERESIETGGVWIEGELFTGRPDLAHIARAEYPALAVEERAFVEGPVDRLCELVDDWDVSRRRGLPSPVWAGLARLGIFGMSVPAAYEGRALSEAGRSAVISRLFSASGVVGYTAAVCDAAARLLVGHASETQKARWLASLARHDDLLAVAADEAVMGGDPSRPPSRGEVYRDDHGRLMLRLTWEYDLVPMAPVASVLLVAFRLRDPKDLLGAGPDPGISLALVKAGEHGVKVGARVDPMGVPVLVGPTSGTDVEVPLDDALLGGSAGAGRGWPVLVEYRAALCAAWTVMASAGVKQVARVTSARAALATTAASQTVPMTDEISLARLAGWSYAIEALRRLTAGAGEGAVIPTTWFGRSRTLATGLLEHAAREGLRVGGPSALSRGPDDPMGLLLDFVPLAGFLDGEGSRPPAFFDDLLRCHPYLRATRRAADERDLRSFDQAAWAWFGDLGRNKVRALLLSMTRGAVAASPVRGKAARYWRRLAWASASFAFWVDVAVALDFGAFSRRDDLKVCFSRILEGLILTAAVLRRHEADGRRLEDEALMQWAARDALSRVQDAFDELFDRFDLGWAGPWVRGPVATWSRLNRLTRPPSPGRSRKSAGALLVPGAQRERLLGGTHTTSGPIRRLDEGMARWHGVRRLIDRMGEASKRGLMRMSSLERSLEAAVAGGILTAEEARWVHEADGMRQAALSTQSMTESEYLKPAVPRPRSGRGARKEVETGLREARKGRGRRK